MAHLGFSLSPLYAQNLTRGKEILELLSLSLSHGAFCRYFFIYIIARVDECLQFKQPPPMGPAKLNSDEYTPWVIIDN